MASETSIKSEKAANRQVLFIQGGGEGTYDEWDNKLVASLERALGPGYDVRYPRMPDEDNPNFGAWSTVLEQEIAQLDDGAVLVGHSIGGTILIHTLAERSGLLGRVAAICLIAAPFVGEGGWPSDDFVPRPDWAASLAGSAVYLYHGDADVSVLQTHLDLYAKAIPEAQVRRLNGRDHQLNNDLSEVAEDIRGVSKRA